MEENATSTQEQSVSQEQQTAKENNPTIITKTPKGLAIAWLVLSLIGLVILILLATVFATAAAVSSMPVQ